MQVMVTLVAPPLSSFVLTTDREGRMSVIFKVNFFILDLHSVYPLSSGSLRNEREIE